MSSYIRKYLGIIFLVLMGNVSALDFQKEKITYTAKLNESSHTATFYFSNNSSNEVIIEKMKSSCDCMAPELIKKNYKTGETGEIKLIFEFKNKKGVQQNRLLVFLKGQQKPLTLVLEVNIPYPYKYSQRFHTWKSTDRKEKKITMTLLKGFDAKVKLLPLKQDFPFKVDFQDKGNGQYDISTTPGKNISKGRYKISLKIEEKNKLPKISSLYLIIQ